VVWSGGGGEGEADVDPLSTRKIHRRREWMVIFEMIGQNVHTLSSCCREIGDKCKKLFSKTTTVFLLSDTFSKWGFKNKRDKLSSLQVQHSYTSTSIKPPHPKMHLMYYLDESGKRVYTLKVS
jgi:hypothetical protein